MISSQTEFERLNRYVGQFSIGGSFMLWTRECGQRLKKQLYFTRDQKLAVK